MESSILVNLTKDLDTVKVNSYTEMDESMKANGFKVSSLVKDSTLTWRVGVD